MRRVLITQICVCFLSFSPLTVAEAKTSDCQAALTALQSSWWSKLRNKLWGLKYLEDAANHTPENEGAFVLELLKHLKIGYDNDYTSTIPERRWNGMWTKFKGNVWDIKYSDSPKLYEIGPLVSQAPEENGFRVFAQKAIHFKGDPAPIAYLVGWEQLFNRHVDWAVHIVFVSGGDFWIFGKNIGGRKQVLAAFVEQRNYLLHLLRLH